MGNLALRDLTATSAFLPIADRAIAFQQPGL